MSHNRWTKNEFDWIRQKRGMTPARARLKAQALFAILASVIPKRTIYNNRLDNPYASVDALKVLLNELARKRGLWSVQKTVEGVENADSR